MTESNDLAEEISLAATIPTIWLAGVVLFIWGKDALRAVRARKRSAAQWMLFGVTVSFFGQILDNSWWGIAWQNKYFGNPSADWWFSNGVFSNIFSRQGAGIIAAFCHIRAAAEYLNEKRAESRELLREDPGVPLSPAWHLLFSCGLGLIAWAWMIYAQKECC